MMQASSENPARPRKRTVAHWKRQIERRPCAAFLVDRELRVAAANTRSRLDGIDVGQALHEWLPRIVPAGADAAGSATRLDWLPVATEDFSGCLVEVLPGAGTGGARETHLLERRLLEAKHRLQEEIRHRQFLERQILALQNAMAERGAPAKEEVLP
jgi:hypothetical protein